MHAGAKPQQRQASVPLLVSGQGWHLILACLTIKPHLTPSHSWDRKPLKERGIEFPGPRPGTYKENTAEIFLLENELDQTKPALLLVGEPV